MRKLFALLSLFILSVAMIYGGIQETKNLSRQDTLLSYMNIVSEMKRDL
ncbi:MAG: hypothetical protein JXR88_09795 [Clostridia bacterium]|nr:hypothetical protein [Clostridia bacterium]